MPLIIELLSKSGHKPFEENILDNSNYIYTSSHKVLNEGVDFDIAYTPLKHLGFKSLISVIGPLFAEGFTPDSLSVIISLPSHYKKSQIVELWNGVTAGVSHYGIQTVTLDLQPSLSALSISLSSQGKQKKELFVQRKKSKPGDIICVSADLGAAYMGLQILEREKRAADGSNVKPILEKYKYVLQSYLNPFIDITLFEAMTGASITPSGGEFSLSGLADAIKRLCIKSGAGAKIFMSRIPIATQTSGVADELGIDPFTAALNGGEDYSFVFTFPLELHEKIVKEMPQLDIIGHLCDSDAGATFISPDGREIELKAQAWDE